MTHLRLTAALAVALLGLGACDSDDAIDTPTPADVAGVYDFESFRFDPDATRLESVDVLDTLVTDDSFVELLDGGQATLRYRREGGNTRVVTGDFEVRRSELRLTFDAGNDVALDRLLLPDVLVFERGTDDALTLTEGSGTITADLEAYDADGYGGFNAIPGRLTIRLDRRADDA